MHHLCIRVTFYVDVLRELYPLSLENFKVKCTSCMCVTAQLKIPRSYFFRVDTF